MTCPTLSSGAEFVSNAPSENLVKLSEIMITVLCSVYSTIQERPPDRLPSSRDTEPRSYGCFDLLEGRLELPPGTSARSDV